MSKAIQIADAMAERLNAQMILNGVTTIVDRQKELSGQVQEKVLRGGGSVIVILYTGFFNPAGSVSGNVTVTRAYTVTIYSKPILNPDATPADDIVEGVAKILHNWEIDENSTAAADIKVTACDYQPDRNYLIYVLDVECSTKL